MILEVFCTLDESLILIADLYVSCGTTSAGLTQAPLGAGEDTGCWVAS